MKEKTLLRIERDRLAKQVGSFHKPDESQTPPSDPPKRKGTPWSPWPSEKDEIHEWPNIGDQRTNIACLNTAISRIVSDGKSFIFSCCDDGSIYKTSYLLVDQELPQLVGTHENAFAAGASWHEASQRLVTSGSDGAMKIWSTDTNQLFTRMNYHRSCVWSLDISDDYLVSASQDHTAKLIDLSVEKCRHTFRGHLDAINIVCFSDRHTFITGSADKSVSLWDYRTANCISTNLSHHSAVNDVIVNQNSFLVASCDSAGIVLIVDTRKSSLQITSVCERFDLSKSGPINAIHWLNDCGIISASRDGTVTVLKPGSSESSCQLTIPPNPQIQSFTTTGEGKYLVSSDEGGNITLWS
jgi:WD40 repeat protein